MTQNLVGVTMERGTGELDIPLISGNSVHTEGSILFKYRKIKIELYDRDKAENASGLGGSMANLLLNDIFIRSNNPGFLGKTRPGEVYFKRNTQKVRLYFTHGRVFLSRSKCRPWVIIIKSRGRRKEQFCGSGSSS